MKFFVGSDHAGVALKAAVVRWLTEAGHEVEDFGAQGSESVDYPDFAHRVAEAVLAHPGSRGVLICGTGLGMSMAANRHRGVRAALCQEPYSARMARAHNDANVLCLGARVVGEGLALDILEAFSSAAFEGGRHARRVGKIEPTR